MQVILRHKRAHAWSGINKYKNCNDYLGTYYTRSGSRYTGLTLNDEERLGKLLRVDLNPNSSFWDTFAIRIGAEEIIINTEDPMGELQYLFLKQHKRVQSSISELKATANYVLINSDDEAKEENKRLAMKRKAYKAFDKMSVNDMRKALRLFGHSTNETSNEVVENSLSHIVEDDPHKFLSIWVDNEDKELQFLVEEAIANNVIRRNKNVYRYGTDIIGNSMEDTIAYLNNKANQELRIVISEAIKSKTNSIK